MSALPEVIYDEFLLQDARKDLHQERVLNLLANLPQDGQVEINLPTYKWES